MSHEEIHGKCLPQCLAVEAIKYVVLMIMLRTFPACGFPPDDQAWPRHGGGEQTGWTSSPFPSRKGEGARAPKG